MTDTQLTCTNHGNADPRLMNELQKGLDDILAGRCLPHKEAMEEIRRMRDERRHLREQKGAIVDA